MLDWQVNEEEQPLPNLPQEGPPARRVRRWRLFGGLLLLLVMVGLFVFRWRLTAQQELMETDLRAFIRYEEQQRVFGLSEQANELMVSNAPKVWQQAYRLSFAKSDEVPPIELEVEEIELNGTDAYVTVRFDGLDGLDRFDNNESQVRFYRLVGQEWRRAPLSEQFWGEERQIELADEGMTIVYPAREEAFVQRLVADLAILFEQWPAKKRPSTPFIIKIEPIEFAPAVLYASQSDSMHEIVFNSPKLVMPPASRSEVPTATDGGVRRHASVSREVHGEAAVRLALADALLEEVNLDEQTEQPLLPGAMTFLGAIRNTFILRWALPDEAIPRQIWHDKVKDGWKSPFLGQWETNREEVGRAGMPVGRASMPVLLPRAWQPGLSEATVLLMADYLYDQYGSEGLQSVVKQLPTAPSWDRIFYPLSGHYTTSLEEKVRLADSESQTGSPPAPQLPLHVTVLDIDAETGALEVKLASRNEPLSIQAIGGTLVDPEGITYTGHCAALYKELTITEGDWVAVGQELQARQLLVSDLSPSILLPAETTKAPLDTFAYLAERQLGDRGSLATFIALSEDGTVTHLTTLPPPIRSGWHLQSNAPWPARFLLRLRVPHCKESWLLMYDPQQGIVESWLTSSSGLLKTGLHFVWRPLEEEFILTGPLYVEDRQNSAGYNSYWSAAAGQPLEFIAQLSESLYPLAWRERNVLAFDERQNHLSLIDLTSGKVSKSVPFANESPSSFVLSKDGTRLFYTSALPPRTFKMFDMENGQIKPLFSLLDGESIRSMTGGTSTEHLLLWREKTSDGRIAKDLRLLDLNALDEPTIVMDILPDEYKANALLCADNRVLVTTYNGLLSEVRMWQPDGSISTLLRTDKELHLLSCR